MQSLDTCNVFAGKVLQVPRDFIAPVTVSLEKCCRWNIGSLFRLRPAPFPGNSEILPFVSVQGNEDEQHGCEAPHGGAAVAEEREWDADDWHQSDGHADVYEQVHEYAAGHAVAVDPCESLAAAFGIVDDSPHQEHI